MTTTTSSSTPGRDKIALLKINRPDVAITVDRERDVFMRWDGDGPHPADQGCVCYDWRVTATTIRNGEAVEAEVHLGGSWYHPDDDSDTAREIGGYLPQMIEEALEALDKALAARPEERSKLYATLSWTADDVLTLREGYSDEQAAAFLDRNAGHIQSRLTELGWDVIGTLLEMDEAEAEAGH